MRLSPKVFFVSVIIGFILSVTVTCLVTEAYGQDQDPKQIAQVRDNTVVTGIVQLDPKYKDSLERNRKFVEVDCKEVDCKVIHLREVKDKNAKTVIYKDSAIVNDTIMFENKKYTINEKTFKIRVRDKKDLKEFKGGAHVGGSYIMITKVDKKTVHFVYQHSAFTKEIIFKKKLQGFKKKKKKDSE